MLHPYNGYYVAIEMVELGLLINKYMYFSKNIYI